MAPKKLPTFSTLTAITPQSRISGLGSFSTSDRKDLGKVTENMASNLSLVKLNPFLSTMSYSLWTENKIQILARGEKFGIILHHTGLGLPSFTTQEQMDEADLADESDWIEFYKELLSRNIYFARDAEFADWLFRSIDSKLLESFATSGITVNSLSYEIWAALQKQFSGGSKSEEARLKGILAALQKNLKSGTGDPTTIFNDIFATTLLLRSCGIGINNSNFINDVINNCPSRIGSFIPIVQSDLIKSEMDLMWRENDYVLLETFWKNFSTFLTGVITNTGAGGLWCVIPPVPNKPPPVLAIAPDRRPNSDQFDSKTPCSNCNSTGHSAKMCFKGKYSCATCVSEGITKNIAWPDDWHCKNCGKHHNPNKVVCPPWALKDKEKRLAAAAGAPPPPTNAGGPIRDGTFVILPSPLLPAVMMDKSFGGSDDILGDKDCASKDMEHPFMVLVHYDIPDASERVQAAPTSVNSTLPPAGGGETVSETELTFYVDTGSGKTVIGKGHEQYLQDPVNCISGGRGAGGTITFTMRGSIKGTIPTASSTEDLTATGEAEVDLRNVHYSGDIPPICLWGTSELQDRGGMLHLEGKLSPGAIVGYIKTPSGIVYPLRFDHRVRLYYFVLRLTGRLG